MTETNQHDASIMDQFTKQAIPFAERHGASDGELLQLLVEMCRVGSDEKVLDIACGPGLVTCAFAEKAGHVTGLDMVPAMLERAEALRLKKKLTNITWKQGAATSLPFIEGAFNHVIARFSFHHYRDPLAALMEMKRVCQPGGFVMVADVAPAPSAREAYDQVEKLRDPSHTSALTEAEFEALGDTAKLKFTRKSSYQLESDLEGLLAASFPNPGGTEKVRILFQEDIASGMNHLGVGAHRREGEVYFFFPIVALVWQKP
jgi:ubiquinone/menaquinone biosynthesis C-methylase UbiE